MADFDVDKMKQAMSRGLITPEQYHRILQKQGVKMMAGGGPVEDDEEDMAPPSPAPEQAAEGPQPATNEFDIASGAPSTAPEAPEQVMPVSSQAEEASMHQIPNAEAGMPASLPALSTPPQLQSQGPQIQLATDVTRPQEVGVPGQNNPLQNYLGLQNQAYDIQAQGIMGQAQAAQNQARANQIALERTQHDAAVQLQADQRAHAERMAEADRMFNQYQSHVNEVASMKVDPDHFWKNKSTGDKVLAGIGLFLGAFGTRGNQAVPVIQNAINQDIDAQKAAIASKHTALSAEGGLYKDMLNKYHDQDVAEAATRSAYLQNAMLTLQQNAAKYGGADAAAKAQVALGQLAVMKNQQDMQVYQSMQKAVVPTAENVSNPQAQLTPEQQKKWVPGYGLALDEGGAKEMRGVVATTNSAKQNIAKLVSMTHEEGAAESPVKRAEAEQLVSVLSAQLKEPFLGNMRFTQYEQDLLKGLISDPTKIFSLNAVNQARLNGITNILNEALQNKLEANGLKTPSQKLDFKPLAQK